MRFFRENRFQINSPCPRIEKAYFFIPFKHPIAPTIVFGGLAFVVTLLIQRYHPFTPERLIGSVMFGWFLWTLLEYFIHRWIQHRFPQRGISFFFHLHTAHHRDTHTGDLLVTQPTVTLYNMVLFFSILFLLTWNWAFSLLCLAGIGLGYLSFEWVHYGSHESKWNRGLWGYYKRYHLHHHFRQPDKAFGITSPLWDFIFRTYPQF